MGKCMEHIGIFLVLLTHCFLLGSSSHVRVQPLKTPMYWGAWSQWSSCSSQCGEGVETRSRDCLRWSPSGYTTTGFPWQCEGYGQRKRLCYGKCENGPIPPSTDECFGLNYEEDKAFQLRREWVEVKRGFPCEIVCRSIFKKGTRTIRLKKNGTPCQAYGVTNGECFAGLCQSVEDGCRDSYGRPLQVDMCMKCGGVNSTCQMMEGTFRTIVRNSGLSDKPMVVRIPEESTSVEIVKYGRAMNTLALIDSSGRYVINEKGWPSKQGDYKIDGVKWVYRQRINQESMTSRGPTVAPITIRLTTKLDRQVVHYSVWVPNGVSLGTEYYPGYNITRPFRSENGPRISNNDNDFTEPLRLKNNRKSWNSNSGEFPESGNSEYHPETPHNRGTGDSGSKRTLSNIQSFDKSSQLRIESHPSHIRDFDDPIETNEEPTSMFGVQSAKTIIIKLDNEPESTLDVFGANTVHLESEKEPKYLAPSPDEQRPDFEDGNYDEDDNDEDIWGFVETELKKQGEDYIWELVEWQLRMRREEAIWELVEEELRRIGEDAIWELVETGLQKLHDENGKETAQNGENDTKSISPRIDYDRNDVDVEIPFGKGRGEVFVTSIGTDGNYVKPSVKSDADRQDEKDKRTRRVNVTLRKLLLEDNETLRVRPNQTVRRPKRPRVPAARRPRPKRRRKRKNKKRKNGRWRPNDVFVSLKPNEHCFPCIRPKDKVRQFCTSDFVSKVHVNRRKVIGNETRYDVTILSSYRNRVRLLQREYIWMESTCRCPRVKTKRTYIVMGNMQNLSDRQTRLVITPKSYVRGFSVGIDRKIRELTRTIRCPKKRRNS